MKKINYISTLIIIVIITTACNRIKDEQRVLVRGETDSLLVVTIPDGDCNKCQKVIEGGLNDKKGIKQTILNLKSSEVSVVYDPLVISPEIITTTIIKLRADMPCYSGQELVR